MNTRNDFSFSDWFGGKPAGCYRQSKDGYQVIIGMNNRQKTKFFSHSLKNASDLAKEWQCEESLKNGLTKNMMRLVEPQANSQVNSADYQPYLEVQLQNGLIMKCDPEDIEHVESSIWTAYKGKGKKTYYARRRDSKKLDQKYIMFHNLICPQYLQVDHINRDGLDNRKSNLREGIVINPKNKGIQVNNRSGITGVYFEGGPKARWIAQIGDNGKRVKRCFAVRTYGEEKAFKLAAKTRQDWEKQLKYGNAAVSENKDVRIPGVMYTDGDKPYWRAQYGGSSSGNRKSKKFSVNVYGYEQARQLAIETRREWEKEFS